MRKIQLLTIAIIAVMLSSCVMSREHRAESIVKRTVPKILNDASTYEPVSTEVDSAFESVYFDKDAAVAAHELSRLQESAVRLKMDYDGSRAHASIYSGSYNTSDFAREERSQASQKINEVTEQLNENKEKQDRQIAIIRDRQSKLSGGKFCGWRITHSFRCANGYGMKMLSTVILITDKDMKDCNLILSMNELDEDNYYDIKDVIDSALR
jgi:hypothetical protein